MSSARSPVGLPNGDRVTVVFTAMKPDLVVMAADSAVTLDFGTSREYQTGRKSYFYQGIGCVTTWGARNHNRIGPFLESRIDASTTLSSLASTTDMYLRENLAPHMSHLGEVGYHVAGFLTTGEPRLWTIFYGRDSPPQPSQKTAEFRFYQHSVPQDGVNFHYNGRNDLAHILIATILRELETHMVIKFDLTQAIDLVRFADFILRFSAEITPQVGPPFIIHAIGQGNHGAQIVNRQLFPIPTQKVQDALRSIGCR